MDKLEAIAREIKSHLKDIENLIDEFIDAAKDVEESAKKEGYYNGYIVGHGNGYEEAKSGVGN